MEVDKIHLRHVLLWEFRKNTNPTDFQRMVTEIYGYIIDVSTCRRWFKQFKSGDYNLEDKERSGRPVKIDVKRLEEIIEANPRLTTYELGTILNVDHETVRRHLYEIGKDLKQGLWVPKELSTHHIQQRLSIASPNLLRNKIELFIHRIITGEEKWILYVNVKNRKQWLSKGQAPQQVVKQGISASKVTLCIWWDSIGVIYWELFPSNHSITSDVYCAQLDRVQKELVKSRVSLVNRIGAILLHDNARPHVLNMTQNKIEKLGWEILPHAPYSPDMTPTDYHLFRSLQHYIGGKSY